MILRLKESLEFELRRTPSSQRGPLMVGVSGYQWDSRGRQPTPILWEVSNLQGESCNFQIYRRGVTAANWFPHQPEMTRFRDFFTVAHAKASSANDLIAIAAKLVQGVSAKNDGVGDNVQVVAMQPYWRPSQVVTGFVQGPGPMVGIGLSPSEARPLNYGPWVIDPPGIFWPLISGGSDVTLSRSAFTMHGAPAGDVMPAAVQNLNEVLMSTRVNGLPGSTFMGMLYQGRQPRGGRKPFRAVEESMNRFNTHLANRAANGFE